ncbi:MAG TPA: ABC transporter permease subunit [Urbifossiella sp.]|jgi:ABC-2 type transport system permease protein|nr:ABC transporter permease subunit [Urbifossiella sp.]
MTAILVRKLLRDVRPALGVVCVLLFLFAGLWVKITQRVTAEITPFFNTVARVAGLPPKMFEDVLFKGPGKVSQAVLGGGDLRFERPTDFLAVGLLHPVVMILCSAWAIGRAAGAVAGELDRGTMELLLSQPVPRNRLILAHALVDLIALPLLCLSFYAGTRTGLWAVGPFEIDYAPVRAAFAKADMPALPAALRVPTEPEVMTVSADGQGAALVNLAGLMFALSGLTMALSAAGRNRWKVVGLGVLMGVLMFAANVLGQLWDGVAWVRPFTAFYYYQPQKIMLRGEWGASPFDLGPVPVVAVLFGAGAAGYLLALRTFTRRDLPAPL